MGGSFDWWTFYRMGRRSFCVSPLKGGLLIPLWLRVTCRGIVSPAFGEERFGTPSIQYMLWLGARGVRALDPLVS